MLNDLSSMFPAHHNLNNQQLKLVWFGLTWSLDLPAHHNLNNQQLKHIGFYLFVV